MQTLPERLMHFGCMRRWRIGSENTYSDDFSLLRFRRNVE